MPENVTKVWELVKTKRAERIALPDMTTLDVITRQLPQGYYSTFRTYNDRKKVLGLQVHFQRLYQPATSQGIKPAVEVDELRRFLISVLRSFHDEVRVRMILANKGQVYVAIEELTLPSPDIYLRGVKVVTSDVQRKTPRLKSTNFISASESKRAEISQKNIFEALLVRNGFILEGMTSNFFYVRNGVLGTARKNILLGVTRRTVLRVARGIGLDIEYHSLKREQVSALSEAFLTSSSRGVVPIVQIDDKVVGEGSPGSISKKIMEGYTNYVQQHAALI